jgi:hypothetical protein
MSVISDKLACGDDEPLRKQPKINGYSFDRHFAAAFPAIYPHLIPTFW